MNKYLFDHEKLFVYQKSLELVSWLFENSNSLKRNMNLFNQIERAINSIALNIAEGTGKYSEKDKCRFYDIAIASAFESAACIDIYVKIKLLSEENSLAPKMLLKEIIAMLYGLIKSKSDRVYEPDSNYGELNA